MVNIMAISLTQALPEALRSVETRPLFVLREQVPPLIVVGQTPNAFRRIGMVEGGSFEGQRQSGEVVSGNDWQSARAHSSIKLDVRLVLRTNDGAFYRDVLGATVLREGEPSLRGRRRQEPSFPRDF
jgi:hypothetical protein